MATQPTSLREIRAELRKIPRDRRLEIVESIRAGRAVADPRDAALAVAWAEYLDRRRQSRAWLPWVLPRARPMGRHAWLWGLHVVAMLVAVAFVCRFAWTWIPSPWHWLVLGWVVCSIATVPVTLRQTLRSYWNAPRAAEANRKLLQNTSPAA
jgi:hypothetical protein